ncbi:BA14K family protein [Mesorhizobium sp. A556]
MNKITSGIMAGVLSVSFAGAGMIPAQAASVYVPQQQMTTPNVQTVQWKRRNWQRHSRHDSRRYWRGHRGHDHYRRGYRRHGNLWFPLAAFATGAIISGAIANDRPPAYSGNSHVQYCYDRYRSYRASDNTFQPYNGPRQQCRSPY